MHSNYKRLALANCHLEIANDLFHCLFDSSCLLVLERKRSDSNDSVRCSDMYSMMLSCNGVI